MIIRTRLPLALAGLAASLALLAGPANAAAKPAVTFTAKPAAVSPVAKPTFTISHTVALKSQTCRVDSAAFKTCGANWTPGTLKDGKHTAHVAAVTRAGQKLSASYTWTIDTPPAAPVLHGTTPYNWVNLASRIVGFTDAATDVDHYSYRLDGGPAQTTAGLITITKQGVTTLTVVAVDKRGQKSPATTGVVKLDNAGPAIGIPTLPVSVTSISVTPTVTDTASGVATVTWTYSTDGGQTWSAQQTPHSITVPHDGSYEFTITATDNAGNTSTRQFTLQQTPPIVPTITLGDVPTWTTNVSIPVSASESGPWGIVTLTYRTRLIGQDWSAPQNACPAPFTYCSSGTITVPGDGVYDIEVTAGDTQNNTGTRTFRTAQDSSLSVPNDGWDAGLGAIGGGSGAAAANGSQSLYIIPPQPYDAQMIEVSTNGGVTWNPVGSNACTPADPGIYIMRATFAYGNGKFGPWTAPTDSAILRLDAANPNAPRSPFPGMPC